jgi:hypothetical protein
MSERRTAFSRKPLGEKPQSKDEFAQAATSRMREILRGTQADVSPKIWKQIVTEVFANLETKPAVWRKLGTGLHGWYSAHWHSKNRSTELRRSLVQYLDGMATINLLPPSEWTFIRSDRAALSSDWQTVHGDFGAVFLALLIVDAFAKLASDEEGVGGNKINERTDAGS